MSFLSDILERKRVEVDERRAREGDAALERLARQTPTPRSLYDALSPPGGPMRIISEVKRASPSVGQIAATVDAPALAQRYADAGAAAISVLTDGPGFAGSLDDLIAVRHRVRAPVLRKDFVVDRYQLLEARAAGADAALLIVAALSEQTLSELHRDCDDLGLSALVEVHDEAELELALKIGARLIGVNNRNLETFVVDLAISEQLLARIPAHVRAISESGVRGLAEAQRLRRAGAANLLVGEALVRAADPALLLRELQAL
ncbi:MAG: indole-3-glycerol phosphate synthase TrpC [Myxococcaceae bacterium]